MKRYIIEYYWSSEKTRPDYLTELSKSGRWNGVKIWFWSDGRKWMQVKYKNDLLNGFYKEWYNSILKNYAFKNCKKGKIQGIIIKFK